MANSIGSALKEARQRRGLRVKDVAANTSARISPSYLSCIENDLRLPSEELLLELAEHIGLWATIATVLVTGVVGANMARAEGIRVFIEVNQQVQQGQLPADGLIAGFAVLAGGLLLLTPGVLTDFVGFALLIRPTRRVLIGALRNWLMSRVRVVGGPDGDVVIQHFDDHRG